MNNSEFRRITLVNFLWLSLAPPFWVFLRSWNDFTGHSMPYLMGGVLTNTLLEAAALYLIIAFGRLPRIVSIALAIAIVSVNFRVNVVPVLDAGVVQKYVLMSFMVLIALITFSVRKGTSFVMAFSLCLLVQGASSISASHETAWASEIPSQPSVTDRKRDIYLLGFDAMVDERGFQTYFESATPWGGYLTAEGFRSIDDARSPGRNTLTTYNKLLSMSDTLTPSANFIGTDFAMFTQTRLRGYRTQFLFHTNHFGRGSSRHWDFNYPSKGIGVCPFVPANFGFYLCHQSVETTVEEWLGIEDGLANYKEELIRRIQSAGQDSRSWLTVAHTWMPGHTSSDYRHDDMSSRDAFRAEYRERSNEAVAYMKDFISAIKAFDRDAIIVLFGDHGAILSRGWENESGVKKLFTESEMQSDRQSVSLYVYPGNLCRGTIESGYRMHRLIADIFDCLEGPTTTARPAKSTALEPRVADRP